MAFNGRALNRLYDWWQVNGNPAIHIFIDYCGRLAFYDTKRAACVASIMRVDGEPCVIDYGVNGYMFANDPFTDQEHQELEKFMRDNNAKFYD